MCTTIGVPRGGARAGAMPPPKRKFGEPGPQFHTINFVRKCALDNTYVCMYVCMYVCVCVCVYKTCRCRCVYIFTCMVHLHVDVGVYSTYM